MANFNTHLFIAATGSSSAALFAVNQQLINWVDTPWLVFIGTIGGLLPDIDSDNTRQVRVVFLLLALLSTVTVLSGEGLLQEINKLFPDKDGVCHISSISIASLFSSLAGKCVSLKLLILASTTFLTVRYGLLYLFKTLTVHRGVFHSLLAALFFTLLTSNISFYLFQQQLFFAWLNGLFMGLGFVIHLLLDEIYSVDLSNTRLKRSFGTALKLYNYNNGYASTLMLICTLTLFTTIPSSSL